MINLSQCICKSKDFSLISAVDVAFLEKNKEVEARQFKKIKFNSDSDTSLFRIELENIPLFILEDSVVILSKYLLTNGNYRQSFGFCTSRQIKSPLIQSPKNELLIKAQENIFTGKIDYELI